MIKPLSCIFGSRPLFCSRSSRRMRRPHAGTQLCSLGPACENYKRGRPPIYPIILPDALEATASISASCPIGRAITKFRPTASLSGGELSAEHARMDARSGF
jgi:hypothetical protein